MKLIKTWFTNRTVSAPSQDVQEGHVHPGIRGNRLQLVPVQVPAVDETQSVVYTWFVMATERGLTELSRMAGY